MASMCAQAILALLMLEVRHYESAVQIPDSSGTSIELSASLRHVVEGRSSSIVQGTRKQTRSIYKNYLLHGM
ncbi:hypothetical protein BDR04DRAFT_814989 [Suillus decipiens]|nr:hypothetical protein BDR04DRAFT_814989 [Suillus decipiens]